MKKFLIITLSIILVITVYAIIDSIVVRAQKNYLDYNREPVSKQEPQEMGDYDASAYFNYVASKPAVFPADQNITIQASNYSSIDGNQEVLDMYEGVSNPLLTLESGSVTWHVNVKQEGFYNLKVNYFPYEGKSSSVERVLYLNDEVPFDGANNIVFHRLWASGGDVKIDIHGNDIRPSQAEVPFWTSDFVKDSIGYVNEPYALYFEKGINSITLESVREPLLIDTVELVSVKERKAYEEVYEMYQSEGYEVVDSENIMVQAEDVSYTTSPTLYPLNDRTSPLTMPSDPSLVKLNTIGGANWRVSGDKMTWTFDVEASGLYQISMRVKQKLASGMNVSRNIYIDGEIPFKEMENYQFPFSSEWRIQTLGTEDSPYLFYLEEGSHEITMEVSLGEYGPLIAQIQNSINNLNKLYREILVYTGPEPDPYRDYELEKRVTDLVGRMQTELDNLSSIRERIVEISGSK